jgi:hypothetical protein
LVAGGRSKAPWERRANRPRYRKGCRAAELTDRADHEESIEVRDRLLRMARITCILPRARSGWPLTRSRSALRQACWTNRRQADQKTTNDVSASPAVNLTHPRARGCIIQCVIRQIVPLPSSDTSKAPSRETATPTGRPHTSESPITNPVTKSSYSPVGTPSLSRMRMTL